MSSSYELNNKRLIALFFIFVLATISLLIRFLSSFSNTIINSVLFYFGFFGMGFVVLSILLYYISEANRWLKRDELRIMVLVCILLALGHASFIGIAEKSIWSFLGYLAGDGLLITIGLFTYKKWKKNKIKKTKI